MSNPSPLFPAIAPSSGSALTNSTGPQRIATRMAENLLSVARSQERALAAQRRYRIGDYEFREADHAQIQRWARMLGMEPEDVVERLEKSSQKMHNRLGKFIFRVQDGSIVSLGWDFALLPLTDWDWGANLKITSMSISYPPHGSLPPVPSCLSELACDNWWRLFKEEPFTINFSHMPRLQKLYCWLSSLTALDLTQVPRLEELDCRQNSLTELDLTPVAGLQKLYCGYNELTALDLTLVPGLQLLDCSQNQLTELDLTPVLGLQGLDCRNNRLTALDLTSVPSLQELYCGYNELTTVNLTLVPRLQRLSCGGNPLTELDLTPVPGLQKLWCDASVKITGAPQNLEVHRI